MSQTFEPANEIEWISLFTSLSDGYLAVHALSQRISPRDYLEDVLLTSQQPSVTTATMKSALETWFATWNPEFAESPTSLAARFDLAWRHLPTNGGSKILQVMQSVDAVNRSDTLEHFSLAVTGLRALRAYYPRVPALPTYRMVLFAIANRFELSEASAHAVARLSCLGFLAPERKEPPSKNESDLQYAHPVVRGYFRLSTEEPEAWSIWMLWWDRSLAEDPENLKPDHWNSPSVPWFSIPALLSWERWLREDDPQAIALSNFSRFVPGSEEQGEVRQNLLRLVAR